MHELIEKVCDERKLHGNEGRRGVENLCKLVRILGYKDSMHFGQFAHDGAIGDLIEFLEDNSGCVEAIKEWIAEQRVPEWREALESELPGVHAAYEGGVCPDCQEEIPDDAVEGDECSNCGHVFCQEREDD
jgi:hypothetical protein